MKALIAVVMGFFSGFLFYMMMAIILLRPSPQGAPLVTFVAITFLGGWALSSYVLWKDARTISKVFSRGFLLGAAEWLCMSLAGVIVIGRVGLVSFLMGTVAVFMSVVCLIGFAISYFIGREMAPQAAVPSKKCPQCAELVQAEAIRCRYCGAELSTYLSAPQKGFSQ